MYATAEGVAELDEMYEREAAEKPRTSDAGRLESLKLQLRLPFWSR